MADLKTSIIIRAVDKITAPVRRITAATGRLTDTVRRATRPARELTGRQRELRRAVVAATGQIVKQTLSLGGLARAAAVATGRFTRQHFTLNRLLWTLGGLASGVYAFKRTFVDTAASFERYRTILESVEGSSEKARASMDWISDFAVKTPFELEQVNEAFVRLRTYGMDPTKGLLRDLGDASSAMGKPLMQAVEAIADAVTGENERLKEFGIKARAVEGGKFRYEYTVDGETRFAEALADDRAQIQQVLRGIFADRGFTGSMEKQSKIWEGMVSNLLDQWTRFQQMVMQSGAFDYLKGRLRALLDTIDRMAADGSLQRIAELVSEKLVSAFQAAERAVKALWPWVVRIGKALAWAADAVGGWDRLAVAVAGVYAAVKLGAVKSLTGGIGELFPAAPAVAAPGTGMLAGAMGKLAGFSGVIKGLAVTLGVLTIKFWLIAAVVAIVVAAIYKYWEPIKAFLSGVWAGFTEALQPVYEALKPFFAAFGEWIQPLITWFRDLFVPVNASAEELAGFAAAGKAVGQAIGGLILNIGNFIIGLIKLPYEIGKAAGAVGSALVSAIGDGIEAAAEAMLGPLKWVLDKARALLPSSDARVGPLSNLTASGASILETMGLGVLRAGPRGLQRPLARALGTAAAGLALSLPVTPALAAAAPPPALAAATPPPALAAATPPPALAAATPPPALAAATPAGPTAAAGAAIDNSIHIQQLTIQQQPGEDAGDLAERVLREIEHRRRVSSREALHDEL